MTDITAALQRHFGFSSFRPGQVEAIQSLLAGQHTLAVMPTGAGKSLIFQLASLLLADGADPAPFTLVISPLIALMKDQVDSLNRRGIPATFINSTLSTAEQNRRMQEMERGAYRLVYAAPERLRSRAFAAALQRQKIALLAVDEAHCISEWGHDFRPDYLNIAGWRRSHAPRLLTAALTATATPQVQKDILRLLGLDDPIARIVTGFNRPNLYLEVRFTVGVAAKLRVLTELLGGNQPGGAIVYTGTRRDAEEVAQFAGEVLHTPAAYYHAGLPAEERTRIQEAFISGRLNLVAATNAFGMGIDRADVRQVIHFSLPGSLEAYYQEAGRAGRDGLPAQVVLLYDPQDRALQEFFIRESELGESDLTALYAALPPGKQVWVSIEEISRLTGMHPNKIRVGLSALERAGALEHLGDEGLRMLFRRNEWQPAAIRTAVAQSRQHAQNRLRELDSIVEYAQTDTCRRQVILRHFGDRDEAKVEPCCDTCNSQQVEVQPGVIDEMTPGQRAALIILDTIRRSKTKIGRSKLVKILRGSRAKDLSAYHHDRHIYYGRLAAVMRKDLEALVEQMVDLGYIKVTGGEYPVLGLTPRGQKAIQQKEVIPLHFPESLDPLRVQRSQAKLQAGGTIAYTLQLFKRGLTPEQIASERGLVLGTIYGHLAQLIAEGRLSVEQVVPQPVRQQIEQVIRQVGSAQSIGLLKARLPEDVDYSLIRCVAAAWEQPEGEGETEEDAVAAFLGKSHPRPLIGPWVCGWSLGFHSRYSGSDWSRSPVGELTFRLKYNGDASALPALMEQALALLKDHPELLDVDAIVPVPPSMERKDDPVGLLCGSLAEQTRLLLGKWVRKTRKTSPQKEMKTLAQKRANVAGAFALCADCRRQRILLVDDLYDSGATLDEITRLCLRAGAASVNVFTLTRTIHSDD